MEPATPLDRALCASNPALWRALSPFGRELQLPADFLPQQTAEARGVPFNATIGEITDGRGNAFPLSALSPFLAGLSLEDRNRALLYSPVEGFLDVRRAWRERQRVGVSEDVPSSLPLVTAGRALALSTCAALFLGRERTVFLPRGSSDDLRDLLTLRTGASAHETPERPEGDLDLGALALALSQATAASESATLLLPRHSRVDASALVDAAARTNAPIVVLVDDDSNPADSPFSNLAGRVSNLIVLKIDAPEDETLGIAFLTFPFPEDDPATKALEAKAKTYLRAVVGSPPAFGQRLWLHSNPTLPFSA